jgi:hypothetical protein
MSMDTGTPSQPRRWTEIVRELQQMQRDELENLHRTSSRQKGTGLFNHCNTRVIMGLPILQEGRDEDM